MPELNTTCTTIYILHSYCIIGPHPWKKVFKCPAIEPYYLSLNTIVEGLRANLKLLYKTQYRTNNFASMSATHKSFTTKKLFNL